MTGAAKAAPANAGRITAKRRRRFLETLSETANISQAARAAGISRSVVYRLRSQSNAFRAAWDEAMDQALDEIEAMLMERAVQGVDRPVFFGGKTCGTIRHYSDALAMFLLRGRRPEVYGKVVGADTMAEDASKAREAVHDRLSRMADRFIADDAAGGPADEDAQ